MGLERGNHATVAIRQQRIQRLHVGSQHFADRLDPLGDNLSQHLGKVRALRRHFAP